MNKTQLIEQIAQQTGLTKADARRGAEAFIEVVAAALRSGDRVVLSGFGSFGVARRPGGVGRNFLTGTSVDIPARDVVRFRSSIEGLK